MSEHCEGQDIAKTFNLFTRTKALMVCIYCSGVSWVIITSGSTATYFSISLVVLWNICCNISLFPSTQLLAGSSQIWRRLFHQVIPRYVVSTEFHRKWHREAVTDLLDVVPLQVGPSPEMFVINKTRSKGSPVISRCVGGNCDGGFAWDL